MPEDTARSGDSAAADPGVTPLYPPGRTQPDEAPSSGAPVVSLVDQGSDVSGETASGRAPLLILGGHRSGTSLVAGLLWHAGLFSGELLPTNPENPRGFFEPAAIVAAHEAMFNSLERDWTCPPTRLDAGVIDRGPLETAVEELQAAQRPWGLKDPRLLFTLPVWLGLVPKVRLLGVVRHPAAVATSLETRNGLDPEHARAVADLYVDRLAVLQQALGFPVVDFDGDSSAMFATLHRVAETMELSWADAEASDLFDPGLRHHVPRGRGGASHKALVGAAAAGLPLEEILSPTAEIAMAALPDEEVDSVPLDIGLGFELRRDRLWSFGTRLGPELGRVLDVAPDGALRPKPLTGVDSAEVDMAFLNRQNRLRGADRSAMYSHAILTGVMERISRDRLTSLLDWLNRNMASDSVVVMDGPVIDGGRMPPKKRWGSLSLTTTRRTTPRHHHLDEIELAALESDWLIADAVVSADRRSQIKLVKRPDRRSETWLTSSERRAVWHGTLERERLRHRLAYEALLRENADLRELLRKGDVKRNAEIRELRKLRSIRGWLDFQAQRLKPKRLIRGIVRRMASRPK